jgi:hypothetical protein
VALYAMYGGQFQASIADADDVLKLNPAFAKAFVARGVSELALGKAAEAGQTWQQLSSVSPAAASIAVLGRADLALYEGRTKDAMTLLEPAIGADVAAGRSAQAATKRIALAEALEAGGDGAGALRQADRALATYPSDAVRFATGALMARMARTSQASALADELSNELDADAQAYGGLLRAEIALALKNPRAALDAVALAQKKADTWLGHLALARAYIDLGAFAEASSEIDVLQKREGEATAAFLDDAPTWRVYAPVTYWLGRTQEGLQSPAAAASYRAFLAIKARGDEKGLVADARARLR